MYARGWISMYGYNGRFITPMPLLIPLIPMSATFYTLSPSFLSLNHTSYPLNLSRLYPYFHYAHAYHVSTMPTSSLTPPYAHISPPMCVITLLSPIPVFPHHVPLMKNPWKLRLMALTWTLWDCLARYLAAKVNKPDQPHVELIEAVMRSEKMLTPSLNKPTSDAVIETSGNEEFESQPI